jgi:molecular chaperone GrpE
VSDDKKSPVPDAESGGPAPGNDLEKAMKEAIASVEARERGDAPAAAAAPSAAEAITESLLRARKELEEALEQTKKEAQSFHERWLRSAADMENYRKRAMREQDDIRKFGSERLLKDFLPPIDDLERAVAALEGADVGEAGGKLVEGVRMVHRKFLGQLEKHGVTTFEAVGKAFDPGQHEAVQQVNADAPAGTVVTQLQRGFLLHERLLRPALVVVSLGPGAAG